MFALDLFNTKYEKELKEGAVDSLEARRIDDLNMRMLELLDRAKEPAYKKNPAALAGLKKQFQKIKAERDSYFKINPATGMDSTGSLGTTKGKLDEQHNSPVAGAITRRILMQRHDLLKQYGPELVGAAIDNVADYVGDVDEIGSSDVSGWVAQVERMLKENPPEAFAEGSVTKKPQPYNDPNWIKNLPKEKLNALAGPRYKKDKKDQGVAEEKNPYGDYPQSPKAFGAGNFQRIVRANMGNLPSVTLEFPNPKDNINLDKKGLELISDYYDSLENDQMKNHFIYRILPSADEILTVLKRLGWNQAVQPDLPGIPAQGELPLQEKKKFDSNSDVTAGDTKVARELQKLRAQYPAAKSDVEAVAKSEIDSTERSQQQLAAIKGANTEQDRLLQQLIALDKKQGTEIGSLDNENDRLEQQLAYVEKTNAKLAQAIGQISGQARPSNTDTTQPSAIDLIPNAPADNAQTQQPIAAAEPESPVQKPRAKSDVMSRMAQDLSQTRKIQGVSSGPAPSIRGNVTDLDQYRADAVSRAKAAIADKNFKPLASQLVNKGVLQPTGTNESVNEDQRLHPGDPVVVTAPNEFEGKTGEIYDFSPSGSFVIVDLYNHGKHSMHLSDVAYNEYADQEEEDDWYDEDVAEGKKKRKKKSSRSMGGYFFPGYAYYGGGDSGDGGGDGGGESINHQIAETALNSKDPQGDYAAKRRALHDLSLNKDVDQAAVLQRRLDLDREAKVKGVTKGSINEFAPAGGGDSGDYFQALASAWYNGTFDSGSLQKGIKSQQDVERLLNRGIVCPDGVTRKFDIGYNSDFDGVVISSDDYYEHSDYDDKGQEVDSRTGEKWGPYDYMEFGGGDLDESAQWRDPKYKGQLYTQEKPDYRDTREYDRAMWDPKPKGYPGRKEPMAGGEFPRTDPLVKGFGRYGVGEPVSKGPRKGLPSRDQITSLKGSIKDAHGKHHKPNLPEQGVAEVVNKELWHPERIFNQRVPIGAYEFEAREAIGGMGDYDADALTIIAYDPKKKNKVIGNANFVVKGRGSKRSLVSDDTYVDPKYRGEGIATMMYAYAKSLGNDIKGSNIQTPMGKKMWANWDSDAKHLRGVAEGLPQNQDQVRQTLNAWMNQDQQYEDPSQRAGFQAKVWPYIQQNIKTILADKGEKGNGDYPAAPYAAWLLVQHMDAYPQNQIEFYNALKQAIPNHPKIQFLRDRSAVNQWIMKNANNPKYFIKGKALPNPTVNVRNPAMFKDAGIVATSREEALANAEQAGNKLLVAAVNATNAQTQPSYKQGVAEDATDYSKRRQRERDVDAGRPVKPLPKNPQTDYARKRAKDRKDMEMGEGNYQHGLADPNAPSLGAQEKNAFKRQELQHELGHERNNIAIAINGKTWKVVPGKGYADSAEERAYLNGMQRWAEKKSASSGKKWTVSLTGANPTVNELSTEKLAQYKTAAALDAGAADKAGNYERGDKRFSGIVKATKKQFANDVKKHKEPGVAEGLMKEPTTRKEYLDQRDKLFRMMAVDSNPANKQIIKQALQDLEARYGNLKNTVKEESSTASEAVERAILNRIMVAHTDLLMKFGPDKVMQAAEEVAYNVGDVDEIGTSDVSAYVNQVRQILGA